MQASVLLISVSKHLSAALTSSLHIDKFVFRYINWFLGSFEEQMQNSARSFVISVCPSVCLYVGARGIEKLPHTAFLWIFTFWIFMKIC